MPDLPFRIVVTDSGTAVVQRFAAAARKVGGVGRTVGRTLSRGFSVAQGAITGAVSRVFNLRNALLGLGVGLAIRKIVTTFGGFEKQMNTVRVLTQATTAEFEALTEQAKQLGLITQFSAKQAAEGMNFLAKAGFEADEVLQALPDTLTLAAAANLDLASAADIVTNILTGLQLPIEDLTKATDVLTQAFTSSNTDLQQLGQAFKFAGPLATTAGLEFEEVATVLAFLGNAGIQASMAGTTLRGAIAQLIKPSREGAAVLDRLGITVKTAEGNLRPFADIIEDLQPIANNASDILAVFGRRASGIANVLKQGAGEFRKFRDSLRDSAGRAAQVAAAQMQGLTGAILRMRSAIEGAVLEIGEELAPTLINAANAIGLLGRNVALAIVAIKETSKDAGEAGKSTLEDLVPSAIALVRAINTVRKAWIGLSLAAGVLEKAFLEMFLFLNKFVIGPMDTAFLAIGATIAEVASFIKRTFSAALSFVLVQLSKVANEAGKIANKLPTDAAQELNKTFTVLAISAQTAANKFKVISKDTKVADEVAVAYTKSAKRQEDVIDKLTFALKVNAKQTRLAGIEVAKLDQQSEEIEKQFIRTRQAIENETNVIKENAAAKQAAAQAATAAVTQQTIPEEEFGTQIARVQDLEGRFAAIGPNAAKAALQFQTAFQAILDTPGATAEDFNPLREQLSLMEELTRVGEMLPDAIRAQFDEAIPAVIAGQASITEVTAQALAARRQLILQNAALQLSSTATLFGALATLAETSGRKGFETAKAFRIAEAIISGLSGSIQVFGDPSLPFFAKVAASAAIIANTFATVQKIRATQPGGGSVGGGGGIGGIGGGGGGGPPGLVVPAEQEEQARGQQITISVAGFIGNEAELASQLSNVIREAQGDDVDFGLETSRG